MAATSAALERDAVLAAARHVVDDAHRGAGGTLFIVGEAGLGKTMALDEVRRQVEPDVSSGLGRGDVMEVSLPFSLLSQAIEDLGGRDVLSWTDAIPSAAEMRTGQFFRVLRWLESLGDRPVLMALDDVHWADPDSLALLSFLCRRITALPVAVIATLRPWPQPAHELAARLAHGGYAFIERLAPLSERAAGALIAARLGRPVVEAVVRTAWNACSGNPLLLEQVATAIDRDENICEHGHPASVRFRPDLLLTRFAGLPPHGLRCAQAASVMGDRFSTELVAEVVQLDPAASDAALEALWTSGLVRRSPTGSAEFAHPMFCQALYEDMPEPLRVRLHARTFDVLARRGMDAAAAAHAIRGGLLGDPTAIGVLEHAGRQALRVGAPGTAAQHLVAAVTFSGERAGASLLMAAGEALLAAGQPAEAMAAYERVLSDKDMTCELRVEALRMLGRALFGAGDHERAALRFEEAIELVQGACPSLEKPIELLLDYALSSWSAEGPAKSLPLAVRARELATTAAAGPAIRRRAEATWGFLALLSGDGSGLPAVRAASRGVEADPLSNQVELCWTGSALTIHGYSAMCAERFEEAERVLAVALSAARRMGAAHAVATIEMAIVGILIRRGRLADALEHLRRADEVSDLFPIIQAVTEIRHVLLLLHDGRWEESEVRRREVEKLAHTRGQGLAMLWAHHLAGLGSMRTGDLIGACDAYARAEELTHRMGVGEPCAVPWAGDAVTAYLRADRVEDARRVLAWLDACAERLPCRWPRIAAAVGRALLAHRAGDDDAAEAGFLLALRLHDEVELPVERVGTLLDYGGFLRRLGQPVRARALLAEALQVAEACGSVWLTARAKEDLAVAGGRRRRLRAPEQLTGQEQRVARLAAAGKTNQDIARELFLAVRTVETHLERIYAKLGIHSRRELITMPSRIDEGQQTQR